MNDRSTFYERYYLLVTVAFFAGIPLLVWGMTLAHESNNNNIKQWLPSELEATQDYDYFVKHFGTDEFALVSWEGCTLDDPRLDRFIKSLNEYEEDGEKLFGQVTTGPSLIKTLTSRPFDLNRNEAIRRITGLLVGHDEKLTCAIVQLTEAGDNNRRNTIAALRKLATQAIAGSAENEEHAGRQPHMAGDAVTNAAVDDASQDAIHSLIVWCGFISLCCACFGLRSIRLVIVVFIIAAYSSCFAESLVPWLGGNMNLVLIVMPTLIYVLTISAGVHIINYYRDALDEGHAEAAPQRAVQHAWLPCTLAAGTTAIGLASLLVSHIAPVKDFGFYSALGILATLVVLFLQLPTLLVACQKMDRWVGERWRLKKRETTAKSYMFDEIVTTIGRGVIKQHYLITAVCFALLVYFGWGTMSIETSVKPIRFFDKDSRLIMDYRWLAEKDRFGPQVPIEVVVQIDKQKAFLDTLGQLELVQDIQQHLREIKIADGDNLRVIGSTMSAATFAPKLEYSTPTERSVLNKRLAKNLDAYHKVQFFSSDRRGGTERFLWRISARVEPTEMDYHKVVSLIEKDVDQFFAARRDRQQQRVLNWRGEFKKTLTKLEARFGKDISPEDNDDFYNAINEFEGRLKALLVSDYKAQAESLVAEYIALSDREKDTGEFVEKLIDMIDDTDGLDILYTGMVPLFHEAQSELLDGLFKSFLLAFALIAALMIVWFRSIRAGLVTMMPNVFPAAVIFGCMGWTGRLVDIGSMMTASVAMGIAVDDTVHFLTWFRRGMGDGMSRVEAVLYSYRKCALAMTQTTMIAGFGILVFALSSFQPVAQFGLLMFVLLAAALVGDLAFLPALLAGPGGRLFESKKEFVAQTETSQAVAK